MSDASGTDAIRTDASGTLDEALERLHTTGPERNGWLTNHAPMAVEALVRNGQASTVHRWLDHYAHKLEELPPPSRPVTADGWREALGDPTRITDWTRFFGRELDERPWREVLAEWWPRLLPGIAASATHPVIRTGHAVRTLLASGDGGATAPVAPSWRTRSATGRPAARCCRPSPRWPRRRRRQPRSTPYRRFRCRTAGSGTGSRS